MLQTLKSKLEQGELLLDADGIGSEAVATSLGKALFGESVKVQLSQGSLEEKENSLTFQATADIFLNIPGQSIRAAFFAHNNQMECLFVATLPTDWNFSHSYPDLPNYTNATSPNNLPSFFYDLSFAEPVKIVFSSMDSEQIQTVQEALQFLEDKVDVTKIGKGLNYFSAIDLQSIPFFEVINQFANITTRLSFHGYLEHQNQDDQIQLNFDLPLTKSFADVFQVGISSLVFYTSVSRNNLRAQAGIRFIGGLTIGNDNSPEHPQNIALIWPIGSTDLIVRNAEPIPFPGFDALATLLEDHLPNTGEGAFPIGLGVLRELTIREFVLHFHASANIPVSYISLSIGPSEDWRHSFLNNAFAIEDLLLKWDVYLGSGQKEIRFYCLGAFRLGGGLIDVSAEFPDFVFQGELALYQQIELKPIFDSFLPNAPMPEISILDVSLSADLKQKHYALELDIASDWEIEFGGESRLALKRLRLEIEKEESGTFATIDAVLEVAGIDVILSAMNSNESGNGGWEFSGSTRSGQQIPVGEMIQDLTTFFGVKEDDFPTSISELTISNIEVSMNTGTKNFQFACAGALPIEDHVIDLVLSFGRIDGQFEVNAQLSVGELEFDVIFEKDRQAAGFIATYQHQGDSGIEIKKLIEPLSSDLAQVVPESLSIDIKNVFLALLKEKKVSKFLSGFNIGLDVSLADLPLVGQHFPPQTIGVENFQLVICSKAFTQDQLSSVNDLLEEAGIGPLVVVAPSQDSSPGSKNSSPGLKKGLNFAIQLKMGNFSEILSLAAGGDTATGADQPDSRNASVEEAPEFDDRADSVNTEVATTAAAIQWRIINKSLGPIELRRVGFSYTDQILRIKLDAMLGLGGLEFSLMGLGVGSPLTAFKPVPGLDGLGLAVKRGELKIGGALLREQITYEGKPLTVYNGAIQIESKSFSLAAIGSFAELNGNPSLFIYGVLQLATGVGPAFFRIQGLAAGFGINRALKLPPVEEVNTFPLVAMAMGTPPNAETDMSSPMAVIGALKDIIPPRMNQYFFAFGIKFDSFKLIESFAMLIVRFGRTVESIKIDLLALSRVSIPPEMPADQSPIAQVELAIRASYDVEQGALLVKGVLTPNSFIFSNDCTLQGGFAFATWLKGPHAGDFVYSMGGYHPKFKVPAHFPKIPRTGFNWKIGDTFNLKGNMYYALTSVAMMAGGRLEGEFEDGKAKAWFTIGADFLMYWKPFSYDARFYAEVGAKYGIFGPISLSVDLHIWGPEFAGIATIDVTLFSFDIELGDTSSLPPRDPIDWGEFRKSFLPPEDKDICHINLQSGLLGEEEVNQTKRSIVHPKDLTIEIGTAIPCKTAKCNGNPIGNGKNFGIAPMDTASIESEFVVTIEKDGKTWTDALDNIQIDPVKKNVPAALWGSSMNQDMNQSEQLIKDVTAGFTITAKPPPIPGLTYSRSLEEFAYDVETRDDLEAWMEQPRLSHNGPTEVEKDINSDDSKRMRQEVVTALFSSEEASQVATVDVEEVFSVDPQVVIRQ